uniref:Evasin n=1 Tax=Rhipicephalus pulchellus TaxID=72859 RepID=L7MAB0_RHIPC
MVQIFSWATLFIFLVSACHHGHGQHPAGQRGSTECQHLQLETAAGKKNVGCKLACETKGSVEAVINVGLGSEECLTVSISGYHRMAAGVNYTCKLGLCQKGTECHPSNLLIGCWK